MPERTRERTRATAEQRERRGRRAIGWGAGIVLAGFALGCIIAFLPVASGFRYDPPVGLDWVVVVGSLAVGLIGLVAIVFGLVELARSRPRPSS